jgi:glycogen synthase
MAGCGHRRHRSGSSSSGGTTLRCAGRSPTTGPTSCRCGLLAAVAEQQVPMVLNVCDDWPSYGPVLDAWSRQWTTRPRLARLARPAVGVPTSLPDLGAAARCTWVSRFTRDRAVAFGPWTFPVGGVVYGAVDLSLFPRRREAPPWGGRLLFAGRLDPRKGVETLVRALPSLPDVSLEIIGPDAGGERARLRELAYILGAGDRVTFDTVAREELASRYAAADAVVFPSDWEEPFGLVPLEAMAVGTPVVATAKGGSAEFLVDGRNCTTFAAGDPADLAAAVQRVAADPARTVTGGWTTAAWFDIEPWVDVLEAWHLLGEPPADRRFALVP